MAAITISFLGCREDIGIELPPDVQRTEIKSAEFILPVTNVYFDSLRTDKKGVLIVGEYADATFGKITSKGFTEYSYKDGALLNVTFQWLNRGDFADSLADFEFAGARLTLDVDRVLTNDDFINQTVEIRTLTDSVFAEGIYLSSKTIGEGALIGQGQLNLSNISTINFDSTSLKGPLKVPVSIDLDMTFANNLYDTFEAGTLGRPFGFSIAATSSNGIYSFDIANDTTELQLLMRGNIYDTLTNTIKKDTLFSVVNFRLSQSNHFSNILRDRTGALIAGVTDKIEVDFNDPDYAYFNELAGVFPKLDFSPVIEFAETEEGVLINRATIVIEDESIGTLPAIRVVNYFFSRNDDLVNINWLAALSYPNKYGAILQTDGTYLDPNSQRRSSTFHVRSELTKTPVTTGYSGSNTVFWQYIYDNSVDDINGVALSKRPLIRQFLDGIDNLVMTNADRLTLGRSLIKKEGVRLKIYYTKPRE